MVDLSNAVDSWDAKRMQLDGAISGAYMKLSLFAVISLVLLSSLIYLFFELVSIVQSYRRARASSTGA